MKRPDGVFDRIREWEDLTAFLSAQTRAAVGIVQGRRRVGKSFLLRALCERWGGLYHVALQQERRPALDRFARDLAAHSGLPAAPRLETWEEALQAGASAVRSVAPGGVGLLVLDELPYLLGEGREIPSVIQHLHDRAGRSGVPLRVIVCGSALAVMSELLSGTRALRGRARLELAVRPFDYRTSAEFWSISDPQAALWVDALVGGSPGYRDLIGEAPRRAGDLGTWAARSFMNPSHALYREDEYLLTEDPRITSRSVYLSILGAISAGATTPTKIGQVVGRPATSLTAPLQVLERGGRILVEQDVLLQRRPRYELADPIVRTLRLLVRPNEAELEARHAGEVWTRAAATRRSQILGPHFERVAREWERGYASEGTTGEVLARVGRTVVNDRSERTQLEVDVVGLAPGGRADGAGRISVLGEAKARQTACGVGELARLDRVRALLVARGQEAGGARLHLFGLSGFTAALRSAAAARGDVELIDLERLYSGD